MESPAKARTVRQFLGDGYDVKASIGHVRDLPKDELGVDIANDFTPTYKQSSDKVKTIKEIKESAKNAERIYLATDPDREGEAISWHLVEAAKLSNKKSTLQRVVFHEITKPAIREAFDNPRDIDMDLVNAQQARRILDRIVGYKVSPILWKKVKGGLSAGRVQSVALRFIVDREQEIDAFKPKEYWNIAAHLLAESGIFKALLHQIPGGKTKATVSNKEQADKIVADLKDAEYSVGSVTVKAGLQRPQPPFTTSTMQQEAARRFHFGAQYTMRIAQGLYEGVEVGDGNPAGLITYMRTDSTTLSSSVIKEAIQFAKSEYGATYADKGRQYKTKARNAQEAHEAIRPVSIANTPAKLKPHLTAPQWKLYDLIWKRTVASQMANAKLDSTTVEVSAENKSAGVYTLRAQGAVIKFDGFRRVYVEASDAQDKNDEKQEATLPSLEKGERLKFADKGIQADQMFTQPPPRYSEAMLIRILEKEGIGRPSTYASIVGTIETRNYIIREKSKFAPTPLGKAICKFLMENFTDIMDFRFTALIEEKLDDIAKGEIAWVPMLREFYTPFEKTLDKALEAPRVPKETLDEKSEEHCELCERPMLIKIGRTGRFLGCSGFPECRNTKPLNGTQTKSSSDADDATPDGELKKREGEPCETCQKPMVMRTGPRGLFLGCSGFPKCRNTIAGPNSSGSKSKSEPTDITCPDCSEGKLTRRTSRRGPFYGCNRFPKCKFIAPKGTLGSPCPKCSMPIVKKDKEETARCTSTDCGWEGAPPTVESSETNKANS